jgi:transposase
MRVVAGLRCNATIQAFYRHLLAAGKAPKVALVACMRKLLVILNVIVKSRQKWHSPTAVAITPGAVVVE